MSEHESMPVDTGGEVVGFLEDLELPREKLIQKIRAIIDDLATQDEDFSPEENLSLARQSLEDLKFRFPDDPDIYLFEQALGDLEGDFHEGRETELDESMDTLMEEMREMVAEAGVEQRSIEAVQEEDSLTGQTLRRLRELGIQAEYVVEAGREDAPIIVLFMQSHPLPEGAGAVKAEKLSMDTTARAGLEGILDRLKPHEKSQRSIYDKVKLLIENDVGRTLYAEAVNAHIGYTIRSSEQAEKLMLLDPLYKKTAAMNLKADLGDDIQLRAYDDPSLKIYLLSGNSDFLYRLTAMNVVVASGLAEAHPGLEEEPVSFVTLGGLHEAYGNDVEHQIPVSHAMAYYGFNVIVVDEAFN